MADTTKPASQASLILSSINLVASAAEEQGSEVARKTWTYRKDLEHLGTYLLESAGYKWNGQIRKGR